MVTNFATALDQPCRYHSIAVADSGRAIHDFPEAVKFVAAVMLGEDDANASSLTVVRATNGQVSSEEPDFAVRAAQAVAHGYGELVVNLCEAYFRLDALSGVTLKFQRNHLLNVSTEVFADGGASSPEAVSVLAHMSCAVERYRHLETLVEVARRLLDIGFVVKQAAVGDIAGRVVLHHAVGKPFNGRSAYSDSGITVEFNWLV